MVAASPPPVSSPTIARPVAVGAPNSARHIAAASGKPQQVLFAASANPDCSADGEFSFEFVSKPAHGAIAFTPARQFSAFAPGNPRSTCNDRRLRGMAVSYTSDPAFRGIDLFVLAILSPSGNRHVGAFVMDVR